MKRVLIIFAALCLVWTSFGQQKPENVMIYQGDDGSYPPCEPSIAVGLRDASKIVAGAVLDYVFTSDDYGHTWQVDRMKSRYGVYGDPCIVAGPFNDFYYFHLSNPSGEGWANDDILDRMVCQRKTDWHRSWDKGWGIGLNEPKDQDKEWGVWDPIGDRLVLTWTQFDKYGDKSPECESNILLSTSKNGKRWTKPITLNSEPGNCIDNSGTAEGAVPAVYTDGSICVAWAKDDNIHFKRVKYDGKTTETVVENIAVKGEAKWAFDIPGLGRANGMPITVVDLSNQEHHGTIYINWADQRNGEDDTDVWVVKSTNGGESWSEPIRVNNDPPGKQQFFTWMTVDPITGILYTVFYDRRNHDDNATDVVVARSSDGGVNWENSIISERPFTPREGIFFGDYNNISAAWGKVRPIWTRYDDGKLSIWTAIIDEK